MDCLVSTEKNSSQPDDATQKPPGKTEKKDVGKKKKMCHCTLKYISVISTDERQKGRERRKEGEKGVVIRGREKEEKRKNVIERNRKTQQGDEICNVLKWNIDCSCLFFNRPNNNQASISDQQGQIRISIVVLSDRGS